MIATKNRTSSSGLRATSLEAPARLVRFFVVFVGTRRAEKGDKGKENRFAI
jgi:hypothetical protein